MEYSSSNTSQKILDHCDGRPIYVLVPRDCNGEEIETDMETSSSDDEGYTNLNVLNVKYI
jgi:hypothetical protein